MYTMFYETSSIQTVHISTVVFYKHWLRYILIGTQSINVREYIYILCIHTAIDLMKYTMVSITVIVYQT